MNATMPRIELGPIAPQLGQMAFNWHNPITGETESVTGIYSAMQIIATQGKNAGCLRASKPKMGRTIIERKRYGHLGRYYTSPLPDCAAAQVWRHVAFAASSNPQHQSLPVMADFDCPFDMDHDTMDRFAKWCQSIADVILSQIKKQPGIDRWARALGYR